MSAPGGGASSGVPEAAEPEELFLLRLPENHAAHLRDRLRKNTLGENLTFNFQDTRHLKVGLGDAELKGTLMDLPCIVECQKTLDGINFYKSADICQIVICEDKDKMDIDDQRKRHSNNKSSNKKKQYVWPHGITPPLKNVRKRRWRKTAPNKFNQEQDVVNEVRNLRMADHKAVSYSYEVIDVNDLDEETKESEVEDDEEQVGGTDDNDVGTPAPTPARGSAGSSNHLGVYDYKSKDGAGTHLTTEADASDNNFSDNREDEEDDNEDDDDMNEEDIGLDDDDDDDLGLSSGEDEDEDELDEQMQDANKKKEKAEGGTNSDDDDMAIFDYNKVMVEGEEPEGEAEVSNDEAEGSDAMSDLDDAIGDDNAEQSDQANDHDDQSDNAHDDAEEYDDDEGHKQTTTDDTCHGEQAYQEESAPQPLHNAPSMSPLAPISTKAIDTDQLSRLPSFDLGSINSTLPAHHNPGIQAKQPTNSLATLPSLPGLPGLSPPHASTYTSAAPAHTLPTYDDTAAMPMDTDMSSDLPGVSDPVAPVSEPVVAEAAVEIDEEKVAACEKELSTLTEKRVSLLQGVQTQINPMLKKRFQSQLTACEKSLEEVQARLDRLKRGED